MPLWKRLMGIGAMVAVVGLILIPLPGPGFVIALSGVFMMLFALLLRLLDRRMDREAHKMTRRSDAE